MGNNNGDDTSPASLRVLRNLVLPIFHLDHCGHTAYLQMGRYCKHQRNMEVLRQQQQQPARARSPQTFHRAPEDMVVGTTFPLRLCGPRARWKKKLVTTISHHALVVQLTLADTDAGTGCTTSQYDKEDGEDERGEGKSRRGPGEGVGG